VRASASASSSPSPGVLRTSSQARRWVPGQLPCTVIVRMQSLVFQSTSRRWVPTDEPIAAPHYIPAYVVTPLLSLPGRSAGGGERICGSSVQARDIITEDPPRYLNHKPLPALCLFAFPLGTLFSSNKPKFSYATDDPRNDEIVKVDPNLT
jgi:hypothetical protein